MRRYLFIVAYREDSNLISGKMLVPNKSDSYLLKFTGDVRLTLSSSFNHYIETLFDNRRIKLVIVDMLDTVGVDKTTLGLIAQLKPTLSRILSNKCAAILSESIYTQSLGVHGI